MEEPSIQEIEKAEQQLYFWYMSPHSKSASFTSELFTLIGKADLSNRNRLKKAFPSEVWVYTRFAEESGYWESVVEKMEK